VPPKKRPATGRVPADRARQARQAGSGGPTPPPAKTVPGGGSPGSGKGPGKGPGDGPGKGPGEVGEAPTAVPEGDGGQPAALPEPAQGTGDGDAAPAAKPAPKPPARKTPVVPAKGPTAESAARREEARAAARDKRIASQRARKAEERKRKLRTAGIAAVAGVVVIILIVFAVLQSGHSAQEFKTLSTAAGCTSVQDTTSLPGTTDRTHLTTGQINSGVTVTYSTSPPSGGEHYPVPLPKGVYGPLSTNPKDNPNLYMAVHSLEHGYVDIWYKSASDLPTLQAFASQDKVLVISYPNLPQGSVALSVWGRLQSCDSINSKQIQSFIDNYKIKYGPEPTAA